MTDQPRYPVIGDNDGEGAGRDSPPPVPRWVWLSAIVVGVLVALAVVLMLVSGGQHGPGRHLSSAGAAISGVTAPMGVEGVTLFPGARG